MSYLFHSWSHILGGGCLRFTVTPSVFSHSFLGHFLFVIPDAVILNGTAANYPGSLFLICYASIISSPLLFLNSQRTQHKASRHLSVWDSKHVYLQIIGELGKRPQRKLSVFRPRALVPWCNVRGCTLDGVDSHSQSLKEQCGGWRCVTAHRVLICSEEGGSNPDLFHPAAQRHGFF